MPLLSKCFKLMAFKCIHTCKTRVGWAGYSAGSASTPVTSISGHKALPNSVWDPIVSADYSINYIVAILKTHDRRDSLTLLITGIRMFTKFKLAWSF